MKNIGKKFTFGKSVLTVVSGPKNKKDRKYYEMHCSVCSSDEELWPKGSIISRSDALGVAAGCGCGANTRWTEAQYRVKMHREAISRGLEFLGWSSEWSDATTKVNASCPDHGSFSGANINQFMRGVGCPKCRNESVSKRMISMERKSDADITDSFYRARSWPSGTIFSRHERRSHWKVYCPSCASDEYARAGLCDGVFFAFCGTFQNGGTPCRCSASCVYTNDQMEYRIKRTISSTLVKFISWSCEGKATTRSKAVLECSKHGQFLAAFYSICNNKSGCPGCATHGFDQTKDGSVYILESDCMAYLKVGISHNVSDRFKKLFRDTPFKISIYDSFSMTGKKALEIEGECHRLFMSAGLIGFDGCTEWLRYDPNIIRYIKERAI